MNDKEVLYFQEMERRRIANELHDNTVQELIHLSQKLELATLYLDNDLTQTKLELATSRKYIKTIIDEMRDIIYDLRPMSYDDIGWEVMINQLYESIKEKSNINVYFDIDNIFNDDNVTTITLYRIIKEACQNILKHSDADNMWVTLKSDKGKIYLKIRDDGKGFIEGGSNKHFGMQIMEERVKLLSGNMNITTSDKGTLIDIVI